MNTRYLRLLWILFLTIGFVCAFHIFGSSGSPASAREIISSQSAEPGDVVINELVVKGRSEWVELYNATDETIALSGWYVIDTACDAAITNTLRSGDEIVAAGHFVIAAGELGDNFDLDNNGDVVILCNRGQELDRVAYGDQGGAPLADTGDAIARVSDGVDTDDYARDWNVAPEPTKGERNTVAGVDLGRSLVINEIEGGSGVDPRIELYNPTSSTFTLTGWLYSDGDMTPEALTTQTVTIDPGEVFVFESRKYRILEQDVVYLFKPDGTRVDQVAGEGLKPGFTLQRVPDGAGPNDGYDWTSSGGDTNWFKLSETLEETNARRLHIGKSGSTAAVSSGDAVSFTLTYGNPLSETAYGVVITEMLPFGVTYAEFVTYTADLTLTQTKPPVWHVGTIASRTMGVTFTVWTTFTGPFDAAQVDNTVWIDSSTIGFVPVSDTHTLDIVVDDPDLMMTKVVTPSMGVSLADVVTYTIVLSNSGKGIAQRVAMTDALAPCVRAIAFIAHSPRPRGRRVVRKV